MCVPARVHVCGTVFWRSDKASWSFPGFEADPRPCTQPPSPKRYYSVVRPSLARMLLHFHLLSRPECEWCSFSNIQPLKLPAVALHKYTTPVSPYNSLQAWKNSDFLYWSDSLAIPNSCMFAPQRILIFGFPFVSALFPGIANKNDSHFYNPWEHRSQLSRKTMSFRHPPNSKQTKPRDYLRKRRVLSSREMTGGAQRMGDLVKCGVWSLNTLITVKKIRVDFPPHENKLEATACDC